MNKLLIIIIASLLSLNLIAQSHMTIRKTDGTTISVLVADVDSIYYEDIFTCGDILTDIDGNEYETVQIGNQCWTAKNLKTIHYTDGTLIPIVTDNNEWQNLGSTEKGYCFYNNYVTGGNTYGVLYNYQTATNGEVFDEISQTPIQGICPDGWHLPNKDEYNLLIDELGGPDVAGGKMKEIGTAHWIDPNTGADNSSGFTALPGGFRLYLGSFHYLGEVATFWSSTEGSAEIAYYMTLHNDDANAGIDDFSYYKSQGMSVRCLKD